MEVINIFGKILYFDDNKITDYMSILSKESTLEIKSVEISTDKGSGVKIPIGIDASYKGSRKIVGEYRKSMLEKYIQFETLLEDNDSYFDFLENPNFDITTVNRNSIIRFEGYIRIPEKFDLLEIFEKNRDLGNLKEYERFILPSQEIKIPLITELNDLSLCTKLISGNLLDEYSELQNLEDSEVTILARVSSSIKNKNKEIYDPLKDYINLNREMRKKVVRDELLENFYSENDYREIEILAIYQ